MPKTGIPAEKIGDRFPHPTYEDARAWLSERGYKQTDAQGFEWANGVFVAKLAMEDPEWVVTIVA